MQCLWSKIPVWAGPGACGHILWDGLCERQFRACCWVWNSAAPAQGQLRHAWLGTLEGWAVTGFLQNKLKGKMLGLKISSVETEKCLFYLTDRVFNLFKCTKIKFRWIRNSSSCPFFFCELMKNLSFSYIRAKFYTPKCLIAT